MTAAFVPPARDQSPSFLSLRPPNDGSVTRIPSFCVLTKSPPRALFSSWELGAFEAQGDVLGTEDIVYGTLIAVALVLLANLPKIMLRWEPRNDGDAEQKVFEINKNITSEANDSGTVFGADAWKELIRSENYVFFNRRIRDKIGDNTSTMPSIRKEKKWVLVSLLALFLPIFGFELFLSVSRQILCGDPFTQSEWAQQLCSPHFQ